MSDVQESSEKVFMTTVCVDKYGRWYDLSIAHPSHEQAKAGNDTINIVVDSFTCTVEKAAEMLAKNKKKKKKGKKK